MAADDAAKDAPDPWDDIVAGLSETAGELAFNFDEPGADAAASAEVAPAAATDAFGMVADAADALPPEAVPPAVTPPGDAPAAEPDDSLVDDWLSGMEDVGEVETGLDNGMPAIDAVDAAEEPPAPLAVFAPDDAGAAAAADAEPAVTAFDADAHADDSDPTDDADLVDFMATADAGPSGGDADPWGGLDETAGAAEEFLTDSAEEQAFGDQAFGADEPTGQEAGDDGGLPGVAAAAAAGTAAVVAAPAARPAKTAPPRPRKKPSAIGQIVGIVLGGLMAIPITLAILIWGLGKDPFKVTKMMPEQVAFLLPEKFRPGYKKPVADVGTTTAGPSLDDLPTPDLATAAPGDEPAPTDVATTEPADPAVGGEDMPEPDLPLPDLDAATDPATTPDDLVVTPPPVEPAAPPPPPPLDTSGLDAAVAEAAGFVEALDAIDDPTDRTRKKLLVEWYKALARVGEQLTMLERTAADSGRTLEDATADLGDLHARIAAQPALAGELERLGRNWLSYTKRDSPGVVLPLTFESARRSGPFWETTATLAQADGSLRPLTVVTLAEPSAVAGDRLVCTGIVLANGSVVWAADCRAPAASATDVDPLF